LGLLLVIRQLSMASLQLSQLQLLLLKLLEEGFEAQAVLL
jgi:hypothetical protein